MDKQEIEKLIEQALDYKTELSLLEFKDGRGGLPKKIWKTVSSFSQKPGGGVIVFGAVDNKEDKKIEIVGLEDIATIQEAFSDLNGGYEFYYTTRLSHYIL